MIDKEKREWMKSVGIIELPYPVSFMYQFKGCDTTWLFSEKEISEKSLEELRAKYEKDKEEALTSAETRKGQRMRHFIY